MKKTCQFMFQGAFLKQGAEIREEDRGQKGGGFLKQGQKAGNRGQKAGIIFETVEIFRIGSTFKTRGIFKTRGRGHF